MQDVYKNIEKYHSTRQWNVLIVFDSMIADMLSNKNPNPVVTKLFIRGIKLKISLVFITQSTHYSKFYTLFYYENSKQTRTLTICI